MAENHQPANPDRVETTAQTLTRLLAEGNWTHRALRDATEKAGRRLAHASIGNIARGEDATPATLAFLAEVMGRDPDEFAAVRLARVRQLFDEGQVGLENALANLHELEVIFPAARRVDRLVEGIRDEDREQAGGVSAQFEQARDRLLRALESTGAENTRPQDAEAPRERRTRDRRRSPEAS